ncbi:hypothetical protein BDV18DRAFT_164348 [Aspergillus unguis]
MHSKTTDSKALLDIVHLHLNEDMIKDVPTARNLGIKVRCAGGSTATPLSFKPAFFVPATDKKKLRLKRKDSKAHTCAKRDMVEAGPGMSSSSSSLSSWGFPPSSSSEKTMASSRSTRSSTPSCKACEIEKATSQKEEIYPAIIKELAESKSPAAPPVPKKKVAPVLTPNGQGKYRADASLDLFEAGKWEVTQILEDTTHARPHAIIEMKVYSSKQADEVAPTAGEIKAIIRVMKTRMGMSQYQGHNWLPILALSYIVGSDGTIKAGRIMQAYHDGRQLVIQASERHDLLATERMPASLDIFVRYFFSEPAGMEDEWSLSIRWKALKRQAV